MGQSNVKQTRPGKTDSFAFGTSETRSQKSSIGLLTKDYDIIPVNSIKVDSQINDICTEINIHQVYVNNQTSPIEAIFEFPLEIENAILTGLTIEIEEKKIVAKVKEKEKARDTYDDAISSGKGAYLVEEAKGNVFTIKVGSLPPKKKVTVSIQLVVELPIVQNDNLKFFLPLTLFPANAFPFSISIQLKLGGGIETLECNTKESTISSDKSSVTFSSTKGMTKDFIILIKPKKSIEPSVFIEKSKELDSTSIMLTYFPLWEIDEDLLVPVSEIIFLIDRSGSMNGSRIEQARKTMQLFLRSLPESVKFNIIGFGSNFEKLFPSSVHYNDENLSIASFHCETLQADLGGTEILEPLQEIFATPVDNEFPRQVFLLTDGDVNNSEKVISTTLRESRSIRVFTFGIGSGADKNLVQGIADASKGFCEMILENSSMEEVVIRQLKRALEPTLRNITLNWGEFKVKPSPYLIRPLYNGERFVAFGILEPDNKCTCGEVELNGMGPDGEPRKYKLKVDLEQAKSGSAINKLAAKQMINDLIDGKSALHARSINLEEIKKEIISISSKYSISTEYTSFVAVEERDEAVEDSLKLVTVPTNVREFKPQPMHLNKKKENLDVSYKKKSGGFSLGGFSRGRKNKAKINEQAEMMSPCYLQKDFGFFEDQNFQVDGILSSASCAVPAPSLQPNTQSLSDEEIVKYQKANGSFDIEAVQFATKLDENTISSSNPLPEHSDTNLRATLWTTALICAFLQLFFNSTQSKWDLVAQKSQKWIKKTLFTSKITFDNDLNQKAIAFLKSKNVKI